MTNSLTNSLSKLKGFIYYFFLKLFSPKNNKPRRSFFRHLINLFIGIFFSILLILVIFFFVAQTTYFKEFLREEVVKLVNDEINGTISIGKIHGTFFSSVYIDDVLLKKDNDSLAYIKSVKLVFNPLQLIFKRIYIRDFNLSDVKIFLVHDDSLKHWNFDNLSKKKKEHDTTKSSLPFLIVIKNAQINNFNVKISNFENRFKYNTTKQFDINNFIVTNFNLRTNGNLYLDTNYFHINVLDISFNTNLANITSIKLASKFNILNNGIEINKLNFSTNNSELDVKLKLNKFYLFDSLKKDDNNNADLELNISSNLSGKDLQGFSDVLKNINAKISLVLDGKLNNFNIQQLIVVQNKSILNLKGSLKLNNNNNYSYRIETQDSKINVKEIAKDFNIEAIKKFKFEQVNLDAVIDGDKNNVYPTILLKSNYGNIGISGFLKNISLDTNSYSFKLMIDRFNLNSISDLNSSISFNTIITGSGFELSKMHTNVLMLFDKSYVDKYSIDTSKYHINVDKGIIYLNLHNQINDGELSINGKVDLSSKVPTYKIDAILNRINLKKLVNDSLDNTNINMNISLEGKSFNIDSIDAKLNLNLRNSIFNKRLVSGLNFDFHIFNPFKNYQTLEIRSNVFDADFTAKGGLKLATDLIGTQVKELTYIFTKKIKQFNPVLFGDTTFIDTTNLFAAKKDRLENYEISYFVKIKDVNVASRIFTNYRFLIDGELFGIIASNKDKFTTSLNFDIPKLEIKENFTTLTYISDLKSSYLLEQKYGNADLSNFNTKFDLKIGKVFSATDIKDINFGFDLNNKKLTIYTDLVYDTLVELSSKCNFDFSADTVYKMNFEKLKLNYNKYEWFLNKPIQASIYKDRVILEQFWIGREKTRLQLVGEVNDSLIYFSANMPSNPIKDLIRYFYNGKEKLPDIDGLINTTFSIDGNIYDPSIVFELGIQNFSFNKMNFGNLDLHADYYGGELKYSILFVDTTLNYENPILDIAGNYPVDVQILGAKNLNKNVNPQPINVDIKSKDFNLKALGNFIPVFQDQGGFLNADINVKGQTINDLLINGNINIKDSYFKLKTNRLTYNLNSDINIKDNIVYIDNLTLSNKDKISNKGKLKCVGLIDFTNLKYNKVKLKLNGGIGLLSSKYKNPDSPVNGDLYIETKKDLNIYLDEFTANVEGNLIISNTDVTFLFPDQAYSTEESNDIEFVIKTEEKKKEYVISRQELLSKSLIQQTRTVKQKEMQQQSKSNLNMNFDIAVELQDENKITFVLPPVEMDQQLVAYLSGKLTYKFIDGKSYLQGKLTLEDNSYLNYIKKFSASGDIIFESDIANPRLDIVATYVSNYVDTLKNFDDDVAVKIKINGYPRELGKNFANSPDNIKVYMGRSNIEKNIPDPDKDIIDAGTFIITGKFKKDLTALDKNLLANQSGILASAGTAAVGAAMTAVANNILGDAVKNIDLRQNQRQESRIYISGKVGAFTYTIGSPTQGWQDLSKADIKLEYNILRKIYFRIEQKQPLIESTTFQNEIKELGVRIKYEF